MKSLGGISLIRVGLTARCDVYGKMNKGWHDALFMFIGVHTAATQSQIKPTKFLPLRVPTRMLVGKGP